jgi:rhodanese-related sulfurtransferase
MNRRISIGVIALAGFLLFAGCAGAQTGSKVLVEGGSYVNVSPEHLKEMLMKKDFMFVNTHIPYEGEIFPTDAFIEFDQTAERQGDYPPDKTAKIVVYCRSGRMSDIAARILVKEGYTNVFNLPGGMIAWEKAGLPLVHDDQKQ